MPSNEELKPCPLCGGEPQTDKFESPVVACSNIQCRFRVIETFWQRLHRPSADAEKLADEITTCDDPDPWTRDAWAAQVRALTQPPHPDLTKMLAKIRADETLDPGDDWYEAIPAALLELERLQLELDLLRARNAPPENTNCTFTLGGRFCGIKIADLDADSSCDKTLETCRDKFHNEINFGNVPSLPKLNPAEIAARFSEPDTDA